MHGIPNPISFKILKKRKEQSAPFTNLTLAGTKKIPHLGPTDAAKKNKIK